MSKRGIIIAPPYRIEGDTLSLQGAQIDPLALRQAVLYWDLIDWPTNNVIHFDDSGQPEVLLLKQAGILTRSNAAVAVTIPTSVAFTYAMTQLLILFANNQRPNQQWSIGQQSLDIYLPTDQPIMTRTAEVELYRCVPGAGPHSTDGTNPRVQSPS